jgi:lipid-binding SYLF domain-containing protein
MYQNLIKQKEPARQELAGLMAAYAGEVQVISSVDRAAITKKECNVRQSANQARIDAANKREAAKEKERQIVEHAKGLADMGLSTLQAGRVLRGRWPGAGLSEPKLDQMAAKHGFVFVYKGDKV